MSEVTQLGYDKSYTLECLKTNTHNAESTTYYLLLKKRYEGGFHSYADMNSSRFDKSLLQDSRAVMLHKQSSDKGKITKRHSKARSVITKKSSLDKLLDL